MPQINDELHSLNIVFLDFHGENVMKRGSDYVMIDLGAASKSPGTEPPTLEKVVKETISGLFEVDKERSDSDLGDYKVDISPEDAPDAGDKKHDQEIYIAETNGIDYNAAKLLIDEFKELLYKKKGITLPEHWPAANRTRRRRRANNAPRRPGKNIFCCSNSSTPCFP